IVPNYCSFLEQAVVLDGDVAAANRLTEAGILTDVGIGPDDRIADLGVLVDDREIADAHRPVDKDSCLQLALVADVSGPVDSHVIADFNVLADPHVAVTALPRDLDIDPPLEPVPVGLVVGLDVADLTPVAGRQVTVERHG